MSDIIKGLKYSPQTGNIYRTKKKIDSSYRLGTVGNKGYIVINLGKGRGIKRAHQLAFLIMTGTLPDKDRTIDHINGKKTDNRWSNLREVSFRGNCWNRAAYREKHIQNPGSFYVKSKDRYISQISLVIEGKRFGVVLGIHVTQADAQKHYKKVADFVESNTKYNYLKYISGVVFERQINSGCGFFVPKPTNLQRYFNELHRLDPSLRENC